MLRCPMRWAGMAAARLSLRAAAGSSGPAGGGRGRGSGGDGHADADLGPCGERGHARTAGREAQPGLGRAVAVAVAVDADAAARPVARASSVAVTQAACSCAIRAGEDDRSIGPVDGPAPLIADLASFKAVSDPIHR